MKNANIVSILRNIAFLLEMEDGEHNSNIVFKIRSYRRASDTIANAFGRTTSNYFNFHIFVV
jgi:DNA polymerase/3'-5' exonuclease PolX